MNSSLQKLHKILKLESERGYDNRAVGGGLVRILDWWEAEARLDGIPEELIQMIRQRLSDYARLGVISRYESLEGLWKRVQNDTNALPLPLLPPKPPAKPAESGNAAVAAGALKGQEAELSEPVSAPPASTPTASSPETSSQPTAAYQPPPGPPPALNAPVTVITGIGPKNAIALGRLGIQTLRDMLYNFPFRYDDYSKMKPINRLVYGETVTVIGTVQRVDSQRYKGGTKTRVEALLSDGTAAIRLYWYNPYAARRLHSGVQIAASGKVDQYLGRLVMKNPAWDDVEQQHLSTKGIIPVYHLTASIQQGWLRKIMFQVVNHWALRVPDPLPENQRASAGVVVLPQALLQIHRPDSWDKLRAAQHRLAFDEILLLQLGAQRQKHEWRSRKGRIFETEPEWLDNVIKSLPYALTGAQVRSVEDLRSDLASGHPMNRLLQGDVGSGKTIVAAMAIAMVTRQGAQAALMAPTSILAEQHFQNMRTLFAAIPASQESEGSCLQPEQIRLMVGATPEAEKDEIRRGLADGSIKLVIGTHALIEDPVTFADLELTIVDEQHRFGVDQRAALRSKGTNPHLLVMTATPIPRSLAMTVYGDLDLSIIDEMPPGRKEVATFVLTPLERERAYRVIRSQVESGRQAFIIYPLVEGDAIVEDEESPEADASKAAVDDHARLQKNVFPQFRLGLLHGRMRPDEKDQVMDRFRRGEYDVLVSTSVVEVGVDVPNATVMLIEGANRFGLAQLHQFRGRVGRGGEKSYCLLIAESADEVENERLQVMAQTNDGFVLAEHDLKQRGPGQFLGTRQSGYSELQLASLTDVPLIDKARRHAQALFEMDPDLQLPEHKLLSAYLERSWGGRSGDIS